MNRSPVALQKENKVARRMASKPQPLLVEEPDTDFDELLADARRDPAAQVIYQETMQRAKFLTQSIAARKKMGLTQQQLAEAMGTSQSAISDLESGRVEPQLQTLQRYARALGCRFDFALV